jgi:hypothetical protein
MTTNIRPVSERERPVLELTGEIDVFIILERARNAMRSAGWTAAEITEATMDMISDDHDHLVDLVYSLCDVE